MGVEPQKDDTPHTNKDVRQLDVSMELITGKSVIAQYTSTATLTMPKLDMCTSASRIWWNKRHASSSSRPSAMRCTRLMSTDTEPECRNEPLAMSVSLQTPEGKSVADLKY